MNLVATWIFIKFLNQLFGVKNCGWIIFYLLLITQFRPSYNDPTLSNFGMLQLFAITFFSSFIYLKKYLFENSKSAYIIHLLLFSINLLIYELSIFLAVIYLIYIYIISEYKGKRKNIAVVGGLCLFILYLASYYIITNTTLNRYSGIKLSLDPSAVLITWLLQSLGSFPLIYSFYLASIGKYIEVIWFIYFSLVILLSSSLLYLSKNTTIIPKSKKNIIGVFGICLYLFSAISIAFSSRYQTELVLGHSYTVVYMQNFGFAMILYSFLGRPFGWVRFFICLVFLVNFIVNCAVILKANKIDNAKLMLFRTLVIGEGVTNNYQSLIINERLFNFDSDFYKYTGSRYGVVNYSSAKDLISNVENNINNKIGVAIASSAIMGPNYAMIGEFEYECKCFRDGVLIVTNSYKLPALPNQFGIVDLSKMNDHFGNYFIGKINFPVYITIDMLTDFR